MEPDAVYERLLKLYPKTFRREYGADMLDIVRRLDRAHGPNRLAFWLLIISDVCRSACREIADAVRPTIRSVAYCAAALFVGTLLFYGIHRGIGVLFGQLPFTGRLVLRGALVGLALGWAQCFMLRNRLATHRRLWQLLSLAGGIAVWPTTFTVIELAPPPVRPLPENPGFECVVAAMLGVLVLLFCLDRLMHMHARFVAVTWIRMNVVALPTMILLNIGVQTLRRDVFMLGSAPSMLVNGLPLDLTSLVFLLLNPVAIAIFTGIMCTPPLWRLCSHPGLTSYRWERG
jgi:hypothetical protein